jgi:flagellar basal body P-ring protein FlgI
MALIQQGGICKWYAGFEITVMLNALLNSGASASQIVFATIAPFGKHGFDSIPDVMVPSISNSTSLFSQILVKLSVITSDGGTDTTSGLSIEFFIKGTLSKKC